MKVSICSSSSFGTLPGILRTGLIWDLHPFVSPSYSSLFPLLELSLLLPDKEILARSYQNPVLFVAILSEALAGVKEKELSTLLTIINSHSDLPITTNIVTIT